MTKKIKNVVASFILVLAMICPMFSFCQIVSASTDAGSDFGYYGQTLTGRSKTIYQALDYMDKNGLFVLGESYEITDVSVKAMGANYANGDATLLKDFGSALDCYRFDHAEIFYVDFDKLSISVYQKNNDYIVKIGSGRTTDYFVDGFNSTNIPAKVSAFNQAVEAVVSNIGKDLTAKQKVRLVNDFVTGNTEYSFCSSSSEQEYASSIRTSFGALINKKAVCEGYSRLFKVLLDKLEITNVLVQGYAVNEGELEPHMWNYVNIDSNWLGVDTTWNDSEVSPNRYLMLDSQSFKADHFEDQIVSSSNFKMPYPTLYTYYITSTDGKLQVESKLNNSGSTTILVSYDSKGALKLKQEDNLFIAMRTVSTNTGKDEYSEWSTLEYCAVAFDGLVKNYDDYSTITVSFADIHIKSVQIAVLNINANAGLYNKEYDVWSKYDNITDENIVATSCQIENINNDPNYVAPPYVQSINPDYFGLRDLNIETKYEFVVTFDQQLKKIDESKPVTISYTYKAKNNRTIDDAELRQYVTLEYGEDVWDGNRTIKFKFQASPMFQHNSLLYTFKVENLVGEINGVTSSAPNTFGSVFSRNSVYCGKIFNDGRLNLDVYGQPTLAGNGDLSMNGWKKEDGTMVSENERSQIALVVTTPQNSAELNEAVSSNLPQNSVLKSETYEINLNVCAQKAIIPNGSYMKLSFGFPAGYSAKDKGVTFKVYHFKRLESGELDYDNPEVLDAVITEYGIVVKVNSFSPYVVVALDSSKVPVSKKGIITNFDGKNGSVTTSTNSSVNFLAENGEITYNFNVDSGYEIDYVLLNGQKMQVVDNKLTVKYADLDVNNTLSVAYIASSVKSANQSENLISVESEFVANMTPAKDSSKASSKFLIILLVVVMLGVVVIYFIDRKKMKRA